MKNPWIGFSPVEAGQQKNYLLPQETGASSQESCLTILLFQTGLISASTRSCSKLKYSTVKLLRHLFGNLSPRFLSKCTMISVHSLFHKQLERRSLTIRNPTYSNYLLAVSIMGYTVSIKTPVLNSYKRHISPR